MLDNREIAFLAWFGVGILWAAFQPKVRRSFTQLLGAFFSPLIIVPLIAAVAWIGIEVWVGSQLSIWTLELAKSTLLWTVGAAGVLVFESARRGSDPQFFRGVLFDTLSVSMLVEYLANARVMSLFAEMIFLPIVTFLGLVAIVAGQRPEHRRVLRLAELLLAVYACTLIGYAAVEIHATWSHSETSTVLLELAMPIWLTVGLLPFMYLLVAFVAYDSAFRAINFTHEDRNTRWRSRLALLSVLHFRTTSVSKFKPHWTDRLARARTFAAAKEVVRQFSEEQGRAKLAVTEEQNRLRRYAGSQETDADGKRLDRREFDSTMNALLWLQTCLNGWYSRVGRYRDDILEVLEHDFTRRGLPKDAGITLVVSKDGQACYAWRRTVTGWCFAIGSAGPPPQLWKFDGPNPPMDFPGVSEEWYDGLLSDRANSNWH